MGNEFVYDDLLSAAKALLVEVCHALNLLEVRYVVVGGWSSFLLNATEIVHPGTKDVDILFDDGDVRGSLNLDCSSDLGWTAPINVLCPS